jgi:hypothetical protein
LNNKYARNILRSSGHLVAGKIKKEGSYEQAIENYPLVDVTTICCCLLNKQHLPLQHVKEITEKRIIQTHFQKP